MSAEDIKELEELVDVDMELEVPEGFVTLEDVNGVEIDQEPEANETADELTEEQLQEEADDGFIRARTEKEAAMYARIGEDINKSLSLAENAEYNEMEIAEEPEELDENGEVVEARTHPLTALGRFGTFPSTVISPESIQKPTMALLSDVSNRHLDKAADNLLGGPSLPHSPIMTFQSSKTFTGIPFDTSKNMSDMEANVHLATVLPGYYAH